MHELVKHDPALAAKILKVVNSAFYGLPSQVASLDRAIVMLGLSAIKNLALAASLTRLFKPGPVSGKFHARDLWSHCISVGVCARLLAETSGAHADEAFVAGLVHDLGLLIEHQVFADKLNQVVEQATAGGSFCEHELAIIGADHQAFGAVVAARWKFPPALRHAIGYHHNPENLQPELQRFVTLIQVADTICCQNKIGFYFTAHAQEVTERQLDLVKIKPTQVEQVLEDLPTKIQETEAILGE
jgi:putative nucleotidyltransferase with HDIG domain